MDPYCSVCWNYNKTWIHILRDCGVAKTLWIQLLQANKIQNFFDTTVDSWFQNNQRSDRANKDGVQWATIFGITCWLLWIWRNKYIFQGEITPRKAENVQAMSNEVKRVNDSIKFILTPQAMEIQWISWQLPDLGWVKLNVCSTTIGAASGLLRDEKGNWMAGFMLNLRQGTRENATLCGIVKGLDMAWRKGWRKVAVQWDNDRVLELIQDTTHQVNVCWPLVRARKLAFERQWMVTKSNISAEANEVAAWMARTAQLMPQGCQLLDQPHVDLNHLLALDKCGIARPKRCKTQGASFCFGFALFLTSSLEDCIFF